MNEKIKIAALGGVIGAVVVVAGTLAAGYFGVLPLATNARLHRYLLQHSSVVYEMVAQAQMEEAKAAQEKRQKAIDKLGLKVFFDPNVAYVTGPADAKNTFVEFFDYNCVHCRNAVKLVKKFYEAHKTDTRFAFIELPINGTDSTLAASAAIAARAQANTYLPFHFAMMDEKAAIDATLLYNVATKVGINIDALTAAMSSAQVQKTLELARKLAEETQTTGTPSFILNGKAYEGEIREADLRKVYGDAGDKGADTGAEKRDSAKK